MAHAPITPEDFHDLRQVGDAQISPDGERVAYVMTEPDRVKNSYRNSIWIVAAGVGEPSRLTQGCVRGDTSPRWSPDGARLAFLSDRGGKNQIHVIELAGGEARAVTGMAGGVNEFTWRPDGAGFFFVSRVRADEVGAEGAAEPPPLPEAEKKLEDERRRLDEEKRTDPRVIRRLVYRAGNTYWDERRAHIYHVPLEGGRATRWTEGEFDHELPSCLPGASGFITASNRTGEEDLNFEAKIWRVDSPLGVPAPLTEGPDPDSHARVSPCGRWIAFLRVGARELASNLTRLFVMPATGGAPRELAGALDRTVADFAFSPDGNSIFALVPSEGDCGIVRFQVESGAHERVSFDRRFVHAFSVSRETLAFAATEPDSPSDIHVAPASGGAATRRTKVHSKWLSGKRWSRPEEIRVKSADGTEIQGWYYPPAEGSAPGKHPLLLNIHGGPHVMWSHSFPSMWHEFQVFASNGYGVLAMNPRGSDGYGEAFTKGNLGSWGEADQPDLEAALDHVLANHPVDPARVYITGGSYGGFMTAWMISHSDRFRAAVAQRGVYHLLSFSGATDIPWFIEMEFGSDPWDAPEKVWPFSPLKHAPNIRIPLLLLHSDCDFRAPIINAEELFVRLKMLRREVVLVRYPREGHELSRSGEPAHRVDRLQRIFGWMEQHA